MNKIENYNLIITIDLIGISTNKKYYQKISIKENFI